MKNKALVICASVLFSVFGCGSSSSSSTTSTNNDTLGPPTDTQLFNTTPTAQLVKDDPDISDNLDLEAVSSVFGESKDLEDFEKRLNDPKTQISNLDLNKDGDVDYLRVVCKDNQDEKVVIIQDIIGKDKYQDVATINVKKEDKSVQVVGNVNIYGPDYYIYPDFAMTPLIMDWFWGPMFRPWISPFYWGYFPPFFRPWRPFPPYIYHNNINVRINTHNVYHHGNYNHFHPNHNNHPNNPNHNLKSNTNHHELSRNDHFDNHPKQTFQDRRPNSYNAHNLYMNRGGTFNRSSFGGGFGGGFRGGGFRR
ncbi:hypothetical protein [Pseudotamlana agarivorans]|uniref:hypothetical protein n=1 Tax=Pseudotamlana agarivorans TaxID=481183 RepID=UPI00082EE918|nr:hypothetical protein [Tamlana agarivorans]